MPNVTSWGIPLKTIAMFSGFLFGYYTTPSWVALAIGGLGAVYAIKENQETGSTKWGNLRWLFIPVVIGALFDVTDINISFLP